MDDFFSWPLVTFEDVRRFLDAYAMQMYTRPEDRSTPADRLVRTRQFLKKLGAPQNSLKVIHTAGTTGKGSTCTFIEAILRAHGRTTGLTLSPHAIDLRERFQVNGYYISTQRLSVGLDRVRVLASEMIGKELGPPSYFELLMALAYLFFAEEQVEYAVIETGLGGRFDPSNVVERTDKLCVIAKLGLDHKQFLGNTLEDIAFQKLGIIHVGQEAIIGYQQELTQSFLEERARQEGAKRVISVQMLQDEGRVLADLAPFERENAATALTACRHLAERDGWSFDLALSLSTLKQCRIPLRFEQIEWQGKTIMVDAAHNPQKMAGFAQALREKFPQQSFLGVVAFNGGNDVKEVISPLLPVLHQIACVHFIVGQGQYRFQFVDSQKVAQQIAALTTAPLESFDDLSKMFDWLKTRSETMIVCTGSFHFAAMVRAYVLGLPSPW
jgi:dihydrofolate synthase/folylpolyglutamate synthase